MLWLIFLLLAILSWGTYDLLFKVAENHTNYFLALLIIGILQVIMALPFVFYYSSQGSLSHSLKGNVLSAIMGILLGLGTVFFFYTFKYGASASIAVQVYGIGTLLIGALGGILIFKETLSVKIAAGFILGVISIILLTSNKLIS